MERYDLVMKELNFYKEFCINPKSTFLKYYDSKIENINKDTNKFFILVEYCPNGTLFDLISDKVSKNQINISDITCIK